VPGTTSERPNWSRALPLPVEDLVVDDAVHRHAAHLAAGRGD
jgi:4-alpha-glucanotransferase